MSRIFALLLALMLAFASVSAGVDAKCGKYKGRQLYMGDKGGCYYRIKGKDGKMNRVYVEKEFCKNCR